MIDLDKYGPPLTFRREKFPHPKAFFPPSERQNIIWPPCIIISNQKSVQGWTNKKLLWHFSRIETSWIFDKHETLVHAFL